MMTLVLNLALAWDLKVNLRVYEPAQGGATLMHELPDSDIYEGHGFAPVWSSFTPTYYAVPITQINLTEYETVTDAYAIREEVLYECPEGDCLVNLLGEGFGVDTLRATGLAKIQEAASYNGIGLVHCHPGQNGYTAWVAGTLRMGGEVYRTAHNHPSTEILVKDGGLPEAIPLKVYGCGRDYPFYNRGIERRPSEVNLWMDITDLAWAGLGYYESYEGYYPTLCSGTEEGAIEHPFLCLHQPDLVGTFSKQPPIRERYFVRGHGGSFQKVYTLFFDQGEDLVGGITRKFFAPGIEGFRNHEGCVVQNLRSSNGVYGFECFESWKTDFKKYPVSAIQRRDHVINQSLSTGNRLVYTRVRRD